MKNLRKFKTEEEFEKYIKTKESLITRISLIKSNCRLDYFDMDLPFYIEAITEISFNLYSCCKNVFEYSYNLITWFTPTNTEEGVIELRSGNRVYLRVANNISHTCKFKITGNYKVGGNLSSLDRDYSSPFYEMFYKESGLISAEDLIVYPTDRNIQLRATFSGCINLISGPRILLASNNYITDCCWTFQGCDKLTESPMLYGVCGSYMFSGCDNLSKVYMTGGGRYDDFLINVPETGIITFDFNTSDNVVRDILKEVPEKWNIQYHDTNLDKYFIKFTIDDVQYVAEYGMTWGNWINSKYNTLKLSESDLQSMYNITGELISSDKIISTDRNNRFRINHVYIEHIDGTLYTTCEWISGEYASELANGVAIINDKCSFVIAKEDVGVYKWSDPNGSVIQGILNTSSGSEALQDYSGELNTELMLEVDTNGAGYHCANYKFANGQSGYLGAAGEWGIVYTYKNNIEDALKFIGGTGISRTTSHNGYWTSTQYPYSPNNNNAWTHELGFNGYSLWDGYGKNSNYPVRAFAKLKTSELQTEE